MLIHGKERHFRLTIGASAEISAMCPDKDITKFEALLNKPYGEAVVGIACVCAALNKGYEEARRWEEPGYQPDPISVEEILSLAPDELKDLQTEAFSSMKRDSEPTVDLKPAKKNGEAIA